MHRKAQIDFPVPGVPGFVIGVAIGLQIRLQPEQRAAAHRDEQRIAEPAEGRKGVFAGAGDTDRRMRLLVGPWHRAGFVEAVIFAVVGEGFLGPGLLHDFERLIEPLAAFRIGNPIGGVAARIAAAPGAENEAAAADLVDCRAFLGKAQRVVQRQNVDGGADLDPFGARRDLPGDIHRGAQHRAPRLLVDFGQPEHVETPAVGSLDLLKALVERVDVGLSRHLPVKLVIPAEFHGGSFRPGRECALPA